MNTPAPSGDRFWTGLSFGILIVFSLANLYLLLFAVPKFGQIYADALPGKPLPMVTEIILAGRLIMVMLNTGWLVLCAYLVRRRSRRSILFINVATICNFIQVWTTFVALFMPMTGTITGMSPVACS